MTTTALTIIMMTIAIVAAIALALAFALQHSCRVGDNGLSGLYRLVNGIRYRGLQAGVMGRLNARLCSGNMLEGGVPCWEPRDSRRARGGCRGKSFP